MIRPLILILIAIATFFISGTAATTQAEGVPLSLLEAEALALEGDPMLASFAERRRAMQAIAIADAQLPDPSFKIGAANLPVDSFRLSQEPMTQLQLGVSQHFPRGHTLRLRGERANARANIESQKQNLRLRETLLEVRTTWLDAYYWQSSLLILKDQLQALEELVGVTEAHYAAGRGQQQDVLRSQLEINLLADKIINAELQYDRALFALARWVGTPASITSVAPVMPNF
ncbi:MAG: TolC family protein, partial [Sphingomonadales bacterium]|nr:TolC family protein [Sphingomonadales bacterium]